MYEVNIIKITRHKQIICTAWNWMGQEKIECFALPMLKTYRKDPKNNRGLVERIHKLYEEADIIVGHNINGFDDKMSNTDFIRHGFPPPPPHKTVDTLQVARSRFRFNSNRLDDLGQFLGVGEKVKHEGYALWEKCDEGDPKAWKRMIRYNIGDVALLKRIYFKLRPWITNHPAIKPREAANTNPPCPMCHARKLQNRGLNVTRAGKAPRYQCRECGHWSLGIRVKNEWRIK